MANDELIIRIDIIVLVSSRAFFLSMRLMISGVKNIIEALSNSFIVVT